MSPRNGNTMIAIVLVVLMMAASVGMFVMFQALNSAHPDPHEESHDYIFEGTIDGVDYTGTGKTTYAPETLREYDYVMRYTIGPVSDKFLLAFTLEDKLNPDLYDYVGTGTVSGVNVEVWTYDDNSGRHYTLYTGGECILYRVEITSDSMSIVGDVMLDQ